MPCMFYWLVLCGWSSELLSGCRVREAYNDCSLWVAGGWC